jgi:hypothetical protein
MSLESEAKPPLSKNAILAIKELNYYMMQVGADCAKVTTIGTLYLFFGKKDCVYTPVCQDMELARIRRGELPPCPVEVRVSRKGCSDANIS